MYLSWRGSVNSIWKRHKVAVDPRWPLNSHMPALSCTPSGSPFYPASPRAPWPSNSWVWTWACGRRSWTRWAWAPGGHTAPGKPSACPYRWTPGQSCRRGRGPSWRHRLQPLLCFHPPWSTLKGLPGPHAAAAAPPPHPCKQGSGCPAPILEHTLSSCRMGRV